MSLFYDFNRLPQWGESSTSDVDFQESDKGFLGNELAPYSQDFMSGYDASQGRLSPLRRKSALGFSNANLCDGSYYFPLFVNQVSIDFSLSGSLAQSPLTRDMYPHNINIPSFNVGGQCYDQASYGMLTEFIHMSQRRAITAQGVPTRYQNQSYQLPLVQLYIQGHVYPDNHGKRPHETRGVTSEGTLKPNQSIRGQHNDILALGYIMSMPRTHQTGVYAPTYTIQFIVANMLQGPYTDDINKNIEQSTWLALLTGTDAKEWGSPSQVKQNNKFLKYAQQHAGNAISSSVSSN